MCETQSKARPNSTQEEKELTDHLIFPAQGGFGKTCRDVMKIVKRYVNSQNPSSNISISNGWWWNMNPFLSLILGIESPLLVHVYMNAMNEENFNHYFDSLQKIFDLSSS